MSEVQVCVDLGTKATFFGLGLLASKKMRPYAKYFIVGGLALSAAPIVMQLVEKNKLKRIELEEQVDEVVVEDTTADCEEEQDCPNECECTETNEAECLDAEPCEGDCDCDDQQEKCEGTEEETPEA